jgi:hypothetical protein
VGTISPWGDVPGWIQGLAETAALYWAVRGRRQEQAIDFAKTLQELSGLAPDELRHLIEDNPVIAELVGLAWEEASKTASDGKRRLFATVAAAAIRGDATTQNIQPLGFLLRTLTALAPEHITLLVIIGSPKGEPRPPGQWLLEGQVEGGVNRDEIAERWAGPADLLDPALAALEGARVVRPHPGYNGDTNEWSVTDYGRRFLDFIQGQDGD